MEKKLTINKLKDAILLKLYSTAEVEKAIDEVLAMVGQYFDVSRVYIFENSPDDSYCINTFEWCNTGINPERGNLQHVRYLEDLGGSWLDNYDEQGVFLCADIKTLPLAQRQVLEPQGIIGMLQCSILNAGKFQGYIGFDNCVEQGRTWEDDTEAVEALVFISRLLTIFLLEQRSSNRLLRNKQEVEIARQQLMDAIPGGVVFYKITSPGQVESIYATEGFAKLLGYPGVADYLCDIAGKDLFDTTVYAGDSAKLRKKVLEATEKGEDLNCNYRLLSAKGEPVWVQMSARLIRQEDGAKLYYATYTIPSQEVEIYHNIVEESAAGIVVVEQRSKIILFANMSWRRMEGVAPEQVINGKYLFDIIDDAAEIFEEQELQAIPEGKSVDKHVKHRNGSYVHVTAKRLRWNGIPAYITYFIDETELQQSRTQLHLAAEELQKQEKLVKAERDRYVHLLAAVPSGISVIEVTRGVGQKILYFNDQVAALSGYSRAELAAGGVDLLCVPLVEERERVYKESMEAVNQGRSVEVEYPFLKKNGEQRYARVRVTAEITSLQTFTVYSIYTDITAEKQAEQMIKLENQYLTALQEENLVAKACANLSTDTLQSYWMNEEKLDQKRYADSYTLAAEQVAASCIQPEKVEELRKKLAPANLIASYEQGVHELAVEYRRCFKQGEAAWVQTKVRILEAPVTQELIAYIYTTNIDKRKTEELIVEHVTKSEFEIFALLNVRTKELRYVRFQKMDESMEEPTVIEYKNIIEAFAERYIAANEREEFLQKAQIFNLQQELSNKKSFALSYSVQLNGQLRRKKWEVSYLDDLQELIILTRSDVTDIFRAQIEQREALRNALIQAEEASKAKSNFLSRMSHEIRTPMNAIIGMNTLAIQSLEQPEVVRDCLSKVGLSARFLLSLINDILDMSRIESGKVSVKAEKFSLEEVVHNINSIFYEQADAKGIDYECVITSYTSEFFVGDAMKIQQVLVNLLGNSIKFTPFGGKVQLIIRQEKIVGKRTALVFSVNDTGVGISPDMQTKIFEPFEQGDTTITTPYKGTGLGLAITKNFVTMMHGSIQLKSIKNVGSEFVVRIPIEVSKDETSLEQLKEGLHLEKLKTLIVDDDVMVCQHTQDVLTEMHIQSEWVDSGRRAVELVRARWEEKRNFDVVLLDWKMPDMDGIETAREIRKVVGDEITIIVMTAYDWVEIEEEAKRAGVNLLVTKPLFKSSLISVFERSFHKRNQDQEQKAVEYDFTGKHILLVEDHILNVEVARRLLENKHATVKVAENGLRAIEMYMEAPDNYYNVILMDIRMPVMDGLTATRSIRQLHKAGAQTVPIIAMSANVFDEDREKSKQAGMNEHLGKPIEPHILFATLQKWL